MSTKHTTKQNYNNTSTNVYDPQAMGQYHTLLGQWGPAIAAYLQDPLKASYVLAQMRMADKNIDQSAGRMTSGLMQNAILGGWGSASLPGFMQSNMAKNSRYVSGMKANAYTNILLNAEANRRWATGAAMSYQPLQTGQKNSGQSTTVQTQSGLGTWLPQVAGAGIGALAGYANGGGWAGALGGAAGWPQGGGGGASSNIWGGWGGYGAGINGGAQSGYWNTAPATYTSPFGTNGGTNPYYNPPWTRG